MNGGRWRRYDRHQGCDAVVITVNKFLNVGHWGVTDSIVAAKGLSSSLKKKKIVKVYGCGCWCCLWWLVMFKTACCSGHRRKFCLVEKLICDRRLILWLLFLVLPAWSTYLQQVWSVFVESTAKVNVWFFNCISIGSSLSIIIF